MKETEKPFYWKPAQTPTWNDVRKWCVFFPEKADAGSNLGLSGDLIHTRSVRDCWPSDAVLKFFCRKLPWD